MNIHIYFNAGKELDNNIPCPWWSRSWYIIYFDLGSFLFLQRGWIWSFFRKPSSVRTYDQGLYRHTLQSFYTKEIFRCVVISFLTLSVIPLSSVVLSISIQYWFPISTHSSFIFHNIWQLVYQILVVHSYAFVRHYYFNTYMRWLFYFIFPNISHI